MLYDQQAVMAILQNGHGLEDGDHPLSGRDGSRQAGARKKVSSRNPGGQYPVPAGNVRGDRDVAEAGTLRKGRDRSGLGLPDLKPEPAAGKRVPRAVRERVRAQREPQHAQHRLVARVL